MLRSLRLQLENDGYKLVRSGVFLRRFNYCIYDSNENTFIADDPIAFLAGLIRFRGADHRVFWMLELNMVQKKIRGLADLGRASVFWVTCTLSLIIGSKIVFPSSLRREFTIDLFRWLDLEKKSFVVRNIPKREIRHEEMSPDIENRMRELVCDYEKIAVYAGSMQEGRDLDAIISHCCLQEMALVLCGPINDGKFSDSLKNRPGVFYLGNLHVQDLLCVYAYSHVGYVNYSNAVINAKYCAPVKIWEYRENGLYIFSNSNVGMISEWSDLVDCFYDQDPDNQKINSIARIFSGQPKGQGLSVNQHELRNVISR